MKNYILTSFRCPKSRYKDLIAFVIITSMSLFFTFNQLSEFPYKKHSWTNCDRLAITLRYVDNNLKPLPAESYVMNYQDKFSKPLDHSITAVDMPLYEYLGAIILTVADTRDPLPLRIFYLMLSVVGLYFLYKLMMLISDGNFFVSLGLTILVLSSPTFIFYQSGFVMGVPVLSTLFIGMYFYLKSYIGDDIRLFYLSIFLFMISSLVRLPFMIILIAVSCVECWQVIVHKRINNKKWMALFICYFIILASFAYNYYIREVYGSMFLSSIMPATSFAEFRNIIYIVVNRWGLEYFTYRHYIVVAILIVLSVLMMVRKGKKANIVRERCLFVVLVILLGVIMYSLLMLKQFRDHDYYFLDTFFFPGILLIGYFISHLPKPKTWAGILFFTITIAYVLPESKAVNESVQNNYWGTTENTYMTYNNYKDSDKLLDSLGIESDARILIYNSYSPNIPFILMNRRGYAVDDVSEDNVLKTLKWKSDYIVIHRNLFDEMPYVYIHLENNFEKVGENKTLLVYRNSVPKDVDIARIEDKMLGHCANTFDDYPLGFEIEKNVEFYNLGKFDSLNLNGGKFVCVKSKLRFKANDTINNAFLIVKLNDGRVGELFSNNPLDDYICNNVGEWVDVEIESFFRCDVENVDNILIYLHNLGKNELVVDDFEVSLH